MVVTFSGRRRKRELEQMLRHRSHMGALARVTDSAAVPCEIIDLAAARRQRRSADSS